MNIREELEKLIRQLTAADPYVEIEPTEEINKPIIDKIIELFEKNK